MYDIEDEHIRKFDSINNGWNTRTHKKYIVIQYRVMSQEENTTYIKKYIL